MLNRGLGAGPQRQVPMAELSRTTLNPFRQNLFNLLYIRSGVPRNPRKLPWR